MAVFTKEEIRELFSETNKVIAELAKTAKQLAETDASLKRPGKFHGGLSNNVGLMYFYC